MSRTKKGKKAPGWEYWGKRPVGKNSDNSGTAGKRVGIQRERAEAKRQEIKAKKGHPV